MSLFGIAKEQKVLQNLIRDDRKSIFRTQPLEHTCIVEKDSNNVVTQGWKHYYKLQFPFYGYKNIPAGDLTVSFSRDIVLDDWGILKKDEKPPEKMPLNCPFIAEIADSRMYQIEAETKGYKLTDKIIMFLGAAIIIELLIMGLRVVTS